MKNKNNAPLWFKWAHKIGTAPLRTKLTVGAIGFAFAAAARLAHLQDTAQEPTPPAQPVLTPAPQAAVTQEDNTRPLAAAPPSAWTRRRKSCTSRQNYWKR